ncbi:MAG: hypothetical protein DRO99_04260, partial [Candidatus Aenigmatarchaeota archaeon]
MGYVYTPEEFEAGIPDAEKYHSAMRQLREGLADLYNSVMIHAAVIHGSNLNGGGGAGSDIDTLVVTESDESEEGLRELHHSIKAGTNVHVDFVPVRRHLAQSGSHTVDHFYAAYLKAFCADGIIGKDPFSLIMPNKSWGHPREDVMQRLEAQLMKMSKQRATLPSAYDAEHCDYLEKLMRQPIYAAIDVLRLAHGNYPEEGGRWMRNGVCSDKYVYEFPSMCFGTEDMFDFLGIRNRYSKIMRD